MKSWIAFALAPLGLLAALPVRATEPELVVVEGFEDAKVEPERASTIDQARHPKQHRAVRNAYGFRTELVSAERYRESPSGPLFILFKIKDTRLHKNISVIEMIEKVYGGQIIHNMPDVPSDVMVIRLPDAPEGWQANWVLLHMLPDLSKLVEELKARKR